MGSENVISDYILYDDLRLRVIKNYFRKQNNLPLLPLYYTVSKNVFGVMNYAFTFPISVSFKKWSALISYSYNVPKLLPYEDYTISNSGYFTFSFTRFINLK